MINLSPVRKISSINIRRPGLRVWSILHRAENRLYWVRTERMPGWDNILSGREPLYSFSACTYFSRGEFWIGARGFREGGERFVFLSLIPSLVLRLHFKTSYGTGGVS